MKCTILFMLLAGLTTGCVPQVLLVLGSTLLASTSDAVGPPPAPGDVTITVLYDNVPYDTDLRTDWGYSALVTVGAHTVLLDTGTRGATLLGNIDELGVDAAAIEAVVLSHEHGDHVGGLPSLIGRLEQQRGVQPRVYVLPAFPQSLKNQIAAAATVVETTPGQVIAPGIATTGQVDGSVAEQALVVETARGLVVITGCAHPGVVEMTAQAQALFPGQNIYLVMGGFHLGQATDQQIEAVVSGLRALGVQHVAPSHCTGTAATAVLRAAYGDDFWQSGAGRVFVIPAS